MRAVGATLERRKSIMCARTLISSASSARPATTRPRNSWMSSFERQVSSYIQEIQEKEGKRRGERVESLA